MPRTCVDRGPRFVSNAVRCAECGGDHHGFGFVTSDEPPEAFRTAAKHAALCQSCAEKRTR